MEKEETVFGFLRREWPWVLLVPFLMMLGAALHEGAHAAAALLFGGKIERFVLFPSVGPRGFRFGWVMCTGLSRTGALIFTLGPFLVAHVHAIVGTLVIPRLRGRLAKMLFFTSVLLPMMDISMLHWGLIKHNTRADLGSFQDHPLPFLLLGWPALVGLALLAERAFRSQWPAPHTLKRDQFLVLLAILLTLPGLRFAFDLVS